MLLTTNILAEEQLVRSAQVTKDRGTICSKNLRLAQPTCDTCGTGRMMGEHILQQCILSAEKKDLANTYTNSTDAK